MDSSIILQGHMKNSNKSKRRNMLTDRPSPSAIAAMEKLRGSGLLNNTAAGLSKYWADTRDVMTHCPHDSIQT